MLLWASFFMYNKYVCVIQYVQACTNINCLLFQIWSTTSIMYLWVGQKFIDSTNKIETS